MFYNDDRCYEVESVSAGASMVAPHPPQSNLVTAGPNVGQMSFHPVTMLAPGSPTKVEHFQKYFQHNGPQN